MWGTLSNTTNLFEFWELSGLYMKANESMGCPLAMFWSGKCRWSGKACANLKTIKTVTYGDHSERRGGGEANQKQGSSIMKNVSPRCLYWINWQTFLHKASRTQQLRVRRNKTGFLKSWQIIRNALRHYCNIIYTTALFPNAWIGLVRKCWLIVDQGGDVSHCCWWWFP